MTRREITLAATVGAVGALWLGTQGLDRYRTAVDQNSNRQIAAEQALADAQTDLHRGELAQRKLHDWRLRSLPTDPEVAESLYQDWLRSQLTTAGLTVKELSDNKSLHGRTANFGELTLDVAAEGTLAQLSDFLYAFYAAPHLHRISSASIAPVKGGDKLTATMTIDGLSLPECPRPNALATAPAQTLPQSAAEFRKSLTDRNLFVAFTPKADGAKGADADAADSSITGMTYGERGWRIDVLTKKSGNVAHFYQGDEVSFGNFKGKVVDLDGRRAVVETPEGRREIRLGQNFGEATPVDGNAT